MQKDFQKIFDVLIEKTNSRLKDYISHKKNIYPKLKKAMLYSLLAGGKRIRPAFMLFTYGMFKENIFDIIDAACAIEMIHTYSLIHDDLPAMDDDDLRRGKPTNHKIFGEGMAILAGDALLTDAFKLILEGNEKVEIKHKAKACEILSLRAGSEGMVSGQAADLEAEELIDSNISKSQLSKILSYIHNHKTADMICGAMEIGCVMAGEYKHLPLISEFGSKIGLCFQITDDILDVIGDKEKLGKSGSDLKNKKLTFVSLYGIEKAKDMADKYFNEAMLIFSKIKAKNQEYKDYLKELSIFCLKRDR